MMRLREQKLWVDPPQWYSNDRLAGELSKARGYLTYDAGMDPATLAAPAITLGSVPLHHFKLMHQQATGNRPESRSSSEPCGSVCPVPLARCVQPA